MERHVYPARHPFGKWLSAGLLILSGLILLTGLIWRNPHVELTIEHLSAQTPAPMEDSFDETPAQQEITLPALRWYALQLGAFEARESAETLAQQYMKRGAAGYVWHDGRYRTLAAVYPLKEDAQLVREQLQLEHEIETYLYEIAFPEISIRLSGMQGQLDILQAAFVHGADLSAQMQQMCVEMDRRELSVSEAIEKLEALNQQMALVSEKLRQRFLSPRHAAVDAAIACFDAYGAFCQTLDAGESLSSFAAKLKYQTLEALNKFKAVYDSLSHT